MNGTQTLAVEHKVVDEPSQMWIVNQDGTLSNYANKDKVVDYTNSKKVVVAQKDPKRKQTNFDYTKDDQAVVPSGLVLTINHDNGLVYFGGNEHNNRQFWHVEYCYNFVPKQNLDHVIGE